MIEFVKIHKAYEFSELSEKAKDRVRQTQSEDWDSDMLEECLKNLIEHRMPYVSLDDKEGLHWDLSYDQNQGVAFYGSIDLEKLAEVEPQFALTCAILEAVDGSMQIDTGGGQRTQFPNSMRVELYANTSHNGYEPNEKSREAFQNMAQFVQDKAREVAQECKKIGYKEIEYRTSDECLQEDSEANGWYYTSAGDLITDTESDCVGDVLEVLEKELYKQAKAPNVLGTKEEVTFLEARAALSEVRHYKL